MRATLAIAVAPLLALALAACERRPDQQGSDTGAAPAPAAASRPRSAAAPAPAPAAPAAAAADARITRADSARILGSPQAKVWVVIASDFQCPYCRMWHDSTAGKLTREFVETGKVRLAYVHFPLERHIQAMPAAEASMCAAAQGKFWEYHDKLFDTTTEWAAMINATAAARVYARLAGELGLDQGQFGACLNEGIMKPVVMADRQRAIDAGVNVTPSFLIGGQVLTGAQPIENFRTAIEQALAATK